MKLKILSGWLLAAALAAGAASAQDVIATSDTAQWGGFYIGLNAGGAWNHTCNSWTPAGPIVDPVIANALDLSRDHRARERDTRARLRAPQVTAAYSGRS